MMPDHISDFVAAMRAAGVGPDAATAILDDDKVHRFRVDGDKAKTLNGAYQLRVEPDGFACGWFKSWRDGVSHPWHSKAKRGASDSDKQAYKERVELDKARRLLEQQEIKRKCAEKAAWIWAQSVDGPHPYLETKCMASHGARVWRDKLLVPVRRGADLVGLQMIAPDGSKRFLAGTDKKAARFSIAKAGDDFGLIYVCEGFATGVKVRMATGAVTVIAFDAGNLKPVAQELRRSYPHAQIVFAADNDTGTDGNPGVTFAQQAAVAIGGARVVYPADGGDWDDVARAHGLDAVKAGLQDTPRAKDRDDDELPPPPVQEAPPVQETDLRDYTPVQETDYDEPVGLSYEDLDPLDHVRPLGHNRGEYYFFPRVGGQIVALSARSLGSIQSLYRLAPRTFWDRMYNQDGKTSDSNIVSYASANLMEACQHKGIFELDNIRGVGAWVDGSKIIVNCGDVIIDGAERFDPPAYKGRSVYESGPRVIDPEAIPIGNREASEFREICRSLRWKRPQYGDMLAGFCVIAAVSSALVWRPHIMLTGERGAGKSAVMKHIVRQVIGGVGIFLDGGTTEAGARAAIGNSGRPFIMDEGESETRSTRAAMEAIFFLARRASSGSEAANANAKFMIRSCFCVAAINPRIEQGADRDRWTTLELLKDRTKERSENWQKLLRRITDHLTPEFSKGLTARTIANIDVLLDNIKVFGKEVQMILPDNRGGDQIGPMLAGAYSLTSTKRITPEEARAWLEKQDWSWHEQDRDAPDCEKLLTFIMSSRARYDVDGMNRESTIGDMISRAWDKGIGSSDAENGLRQYGIKIEGRRLLISNTHPQLKKILTDTPWGEWRRTMSDYPGANGYDNKAIRFGSGHQSKCVSLPIDDLLDIEMGEELPLEDETWK